MTSTARSRYLMVVAFLVLVLNTWVAAHALASFFNAQRWLTHTFETLTETEGVFLEMSMANSTARGYLLTGDPTFFSRYRDAAASVQGGVDRIQRLTLDNVSQQQRIALLRKRVALKLSALNAVVAARHEHPDMTTVPSSILRSALADSPDGGISVRYAITQIENEEKRLLKDRTATSGDARRNMIAAFTTVTVLDLVLLIVAFQQLETMRDSREKLAGRAAEIATLNGELKAFNNELEARVEQRTRELENSNQELQAFSYSVSHDLRAPLRTIDGFSLALMEDYSDRLDADGRDYIERIRGGVQRMGMLIDALLQLSRVTRSEVQREEIDLSQLSTLIFGELQAVEEKRGAVFVVQPGVVAEADPRLMRVAFENLLGNCLKFTSKTPDAQIAFGRMDRNGQTVYFIEDNGAGFDMQYVDRLFTAFQRLHGDRDFKGSGIGLATVSRIIRRHHGEIWAEGEPGRGAKFFFTLEAVAGQETSLSERERTE